MTGTAERSAKVAKHSKTPEVQGLQVAAKLAIEMALLAVNCRGTEDAYRLGQVRGLRPARSLPRFTVRALGKHITGNVSVNAIDAEILQLEASQTAARPVSA
jgi:hypothetical protein